MKNAACHAFEKPESTKLITQQVCQRVHFAYSAAIELTPGFAKLPWTTSPIMLYCSDMRNKSTAHRKTMNELITDTSEDKWVNEMLPVMGRYVHRTAFSVGFTCWNLSPHPTSVSLGPYSLQAATPMPHGPRGFQSTDKDGISPLHRERHF